MPESTEPNWTHQVSSFTSTRWVWRRETTTITWWPLLHNSGGEGHDGHTNDGPGHGTGHQPDEDARRKDWYCPCRQHNWHSRDTCYKCGIPRGMDSPSGTTQQGTVLPAKDGTKSTTNAEDQPKGSNANKEDANQPTDPK